jgi:hypothetical protein
LQLYLNNRIRWGNGSESGKFLNLGAVRIETRDWLRGYNMIEAIEEPRWFAFGDEQRAMLRFNKILGDGVIKN